MLFTHQALSQPQAAAFCKAQLGDGASLVDGNPLVLAAAQGLVQSANVSGGLPLLLARACASLTPLVCFDTTVLPTC